MTASFLLTLDTHAPVVIWGAITGADAGEVLIVDYVTDEPAITRAELQLPGGPTLSMALGVGQLSAPIPGDARQGTAVLTAYVQDDVGNAGTATLDIALGGVIPPVVTPPSQGFPRTGAVAPRVIRSIGRAGVSSRDRVRAQVSARSGARVSARYVLPTMRRLVFRDAATAQSTGRIRGKLTTVSQATTHGPPDVIRRREGPNTEDELIVLGLL